MPPNAAERRANQRQAKKKRMLFVLLPVLVIVLALTVPRTLKQMRGDEAAPQGGTTAASTEAATTTPVDPAAETAPPVSGDPTEIAASSKKVLEDTDAPPEADEGQLISFTRFEARDPFVQLVDDQPKDTSTTDGSGATPTTPTTPEPTPTTPTTPTTPNTPPPPTGGTDEPAPTRVKIVVNGRASVLDVGDSFPEKDPAFKIVSIGAGSVEIGLVDGSFSTGGDTITVKVGEPVTLISQPDGARYTIRLIGPA